ncbi:bi-domain-containing oxidoreductase [Dyadobacter sandarakinus]|uniref:Gfo/Idh/MocA family oxidoreductase n=1 Tax=Dyadobacter sandarakinus TaxID=2747268 RepID=A0ABX7IB63_9BACT|nr:bi-domain-containing oxidoreductase [Dyadobacter sandarakinus]QRR02767.1 Gfo/Idh/MocA family oxidoreductase [Dyadobacter sandarakinus]
MQQLLQQLRTGDISVHNIPAPQVRKGCLLIQTRKSLVSTGTERMLAQFGHAGLLQRAWQQPEKVRQVLDKVRADGLVPAWKAVQGKMQEVLPLGYCNAGTVLAVGQEVTGFQVGSRVVSNGPHAEIVCVHQNLAALIPDQVPDEDAVFTVPASIGLQSIRLLNPSLGETIVVIGLGLVGLLTAQLLIRNGCQVIGLELNEAKLHLARTLGITCIHPDHTSASDFIQDLTGGHGADGVIVATSSRSHAVLAQAARLSRKRGRIILAGTAGMHLSRPDFYEKELSFQVSCSYGPGRYDLHYEQHGTDYPLPFVRWTANRNFQTILKILSQGTLQVKPLLSHIFSLSDHPQAYASLNNPDTIAVLFDYPQQIETNTIVRMPHVSTRPAKGSAGIIGAGQFVKGNLLPLLKNIPVRGIASAAGISAAMLADKYNIPIRTTDYRHLLADPDIQLICIATRHHLHASLTGEALQAGKHVYVEKPLVLTRQEYDTLVSIRNQAGTQGLLLHVGFNRRFSEHVIRMKALLGGARMHLSISINAGSINAGSWVNDPETGGGRILGEACHFIDLAICLTGSLVTRICSQLSSNEEASVMLRHANGSATVIQYITGGHKAYSKERMEAHSLGRTLVLDNFRTLTGYGFPHFSKYSSAQDKGHAAQFAGLARLVREGGQPLISAEELFNGALATLSIAESWQSASWIDLP